MTMSVSHVQQSRLDAGLQCVMLTFDSAEAELLLGGVVDNVLSSILLTFFHILEMKRPLSVDTASPGRLKFLTHPRMNALQQSTVVELTIGTASRSLVVLHRLVRRYLYPSDSGRGPTMSIHKSENRGFLTSFCFKGVRIAQILANFIPGSFNVAHIVRKIVFFRYVLFLHFPITYREMSGLNILPISKPIK